MPLSPADVIMRTDLSGVARAIAAAGWDEAACLRVQAHMSRLGNPPVEEAARLLDEPHGVRVLAQLWGLGMAVPRAVLGPVLGEDAIGVLLALGMLTLDGGLIRAELSVLPSDGFMTTRDFYSAFRERPIEAEYVLGIGPSTRTLAAVTPRRRCGAALDLGTGQGFLAMLASRHSGRVVATDINARALSAAALAFRLSGIDTIEPVLGSFFEPPATAGPFDLIVTNPPFVIQPSTDRVCFSSGMQGDGCMEHIVRHGPGRLREGGYLCVIGNWSHQTQDDWGKRPGEWAEGSGCDLLVVRSRWWTPRAYAKGWISELSEGGASAGRDMQLDEWLRHYEREGISLISMGVLIFRKRRGPNWRRCESLALEQVRGEGGAQIERLFENQTLLVERGVEEAMNMPMAPAPTLEVSTRHAPRAGGGFEPTMMALRQTAGLDFEVKVQQGALEVLSRLDGARSIREVVGQIAAQHGVDAGPMLESVRPLVEVLLAQGFIEPSRGGPQRTPIGGPGRV
jgi:SAM-dependent methyltransferase